MPETAGDGGLSILSTLSIHIPRRRPMTVFSCALDTTQPQPPLSFFSLSLSSREYREGRGRAEDGGFRHLYFKCRGVGGIEAGFLVQEPHLTGRCFPWYFFLISYERENGYGWVVCCLRAAT